VWCYSGVVLAFYRGRGSAGEEMPVGNSRGFTADAIDGRGFKRGNQCGGVRGFDWHRNDGGREARGDQLRLGTGEACFESADAGETTKLTGGACVTVTEEEGIIAGLRKLKEEAAFGKYARAAQARMGQARAAACGAERANTGEAGPGELNSEEKFFSNKNWIFEFTKALKICRRRFRRNFDMRIFPKFF
jgi:hypothetical protein